VRRLLATKIGALLSAAVPVDVEAGELEAEAALVAATLDAALVEETVGFPMRIGPPILKWFWHW